MSEVKEAVFSIDDSKSPGPDGFTARFYKLHWEDLKHMLFSAITSVFQSGRLPHGLNHNFIILVPEKDKLHNISDYHQYLVLMFFKK